MQGRGGDQLEVGGDPDRWAPLSVRERGREWRWAGAAELGQKRELGRGRKMGWVFSFLFFSNPFQIFFKPFLNSNL
jgi:hypothetical protein